MARYLPDLDRLSMRLSKGYWTITNLVGLPIIQLTTIGAKSGLPRTVPLVSLVDGERIALIGSNFRKLHHPAWVHNLKANPKCQVQFSGESKPYFARVAKGDEREIYWQMAVSYYAGYEKYKARAGDRQIQVVVLEPTS